MSTEKLRSEEGVALVAAMLAGIVLAGIALVLFSTANQNLQVTATSRDRDDAIHTAETGADLVVARLNAKPTQHTSDGTGAAHELPADDGDSEVRAWAVAIAEEAFQAVSANARAPQFNEQLLADRFSIGIRPLDAEGEPLDEIWGVGIVDGGSPQVRVVVYEIDEEPFVPGHAVLVGGNLTISGGPEITGDAGAVHTNATLTATGSVRIEETATASGTCSAGSNVKIGENGTGTCQAAQPIVSIPRVLAAEKYHEYFETFIDEHKEHWYDLCPDGSVRRWSKNGPCDLTGPAQSAQGWNFSVHPQNGHIWSRSGGGEAHGVFYAHHANIEVGGTQKLHNATLIASKHPTGEARKSGNVTIGGNTSMQPLISSLAILADRDISSAGNISSGAVIAGEQVDWGGNLGAVGSGQFGIVIAQDLTSASNLVTGNHIHGNIHIRYDGEVTLPFFNGIRVGVWNELWPGAG